MFSGANEQSAEHLSGLNWADLLCVGLLQALLSGVLGNV